MQAPMIVLLLVALVAANLPFLSQRFAGFIPLKRKHFGYHLLEWLVLFILVGLLAYFLESRLAPIHAQNWQFYVVTLCLFVVLAFPGFCYRYFWRKRA